MTDPRPVEGPDREALGDLLAHHAFSRVNDDGWSVCLCGHVAEGDDDDGSHARHQADAVLALLPSPLAPGGDLCVYCTVTRYGCDALRAKGNACCSKCKHVPAPGGGDTDLRASAPTVLDLEDPIYDGQTLPDALRDFDHVHSTTGVCVKNVAGPFCAPAALTARPDADRDALARVRALAERWEADPALKHSARYVYDLRAALARDTDGGGRG